MSSDELFPLVDENGAVVGKATRRECHSGSMLLHPVVHLHVFNARGELYLQKRSTDKDIQPGRWDTSVGGHVDYGEPVETALRREAHEELGLHSIEPRLLYRYLFQSQVERELVNTYMTTVADDTAVQPDPGEIETGRFWSISEIRENLGKEVFTPNFEQEFAHLTAHLGL